MEKLNGEQMEQALRFLLHRMDMATRHEMMATLPQVYGRLYSSITADTILAHVRVGLDKRDGNCGIRHGNRSVVARPHEPGPYRVQQHRHHHRRPAARNRA